MTNQELYKRLVELVSEVSQAGIAGEIFEAAKAGDAAMVSFAIDEFKKGMPKLYEKIWAFANDFNETKVPAIISGDEIELFGMKKDERKGIYVFNPAEIDALSFYTVILLSEMDEFYFFIDWGTEIESSEKPFLRAIEEAGYPEVADFILNNTVPEWLDKQFGGYLSLPELLVDVVLGDLP